MSKQKSHGKAKKKGSQLVIRVEKSERDAFVSLCDRLDTSAAREIRRFMRELVAAHSGDGVAAGSSEMSVVPEASVDEPKTAVVEPTAILDEPAVASEGATAEDAAKPKKKQKQVAH